MPTAVEMPKYKCHKEVWALKIAKIEKDSDVAAIEDRETDGAATLSFEEDGYGDIIVSPSYVRKHNPQVGGYYVVYQDGYKSFSPAEAFETGYTRMNSDYKNRVVEEKEQLDIKISKLSAFVFSGKFTEIENIKEREYMERQLHYMMDYSRCLRERILSFNNSR